MPMKAALAWGHPMMSPLLMSTRSNALQWLSAHLLGADLAPLTGSTPPPPSPLDVVIQRGGRNCPPLPPPRLVCPAIQGGGGPSRISK
jgi:hypothetical protein